MFANNPSNTAVPSTGPVLIVVATYNERENLPKLVDLILQHAPRADLLVVDDNSPDGTGTWAQQHAANEPRLHVHSRAGKLGLGSAIIMAMQQAVAEGYDYLLNLDADFSHDPASIPQLIAGMAASDSGPGADVMIGSRYMPGGRTVGWPWYRQLVSRLLNTYTRWMLRLPLRDCSSGFRCFRTATLAKLDWGQVRSHGYAFHEEILWHVKRAGARFGETPIVFTERRAGRSKINLKEAWSAVSMITRLGIG